MASAGVHEHAARAAADRPSAGRDETGKERQDRNLIELLQELRVAIPGVQVLFAFLLTVPFTDQFGGLTSFEKNLFFVVLLLTAIASCLLIAPTMYHRIEFRQDDKEHIVQVSNRFAIWGLGVLALAMVGAIMLITHVLFGAAQTVVFTLAIAAVFALFWYALPLLRRAARDDGW